MPNRIIKESICTSDSLSKLTDFEENLFYKLIVNCDDYGRFDARPAIIKARCYPLRERLTHKNIEDALSSLARVGCIEIYEIENKSFLRLPAWEVHQQVRAKKPKFPAPDSNGYQMISDDIKCSRNPIQSESNPNPIRSEGRAPPLDGFSSAEREVVEAWLKYKSERKDKYTPTGLQTLIARFRKSFDSYGVEQVRDVVDTSISSMYAGVVWDRLRPAPKENKPTVKDIYGGDFDCNKT